MDIVFEDTEHYDSEAEIIRFYGHTLGNAVSFGCSREALMDAERVTAATKNDLLTAFTKYRRRIREIARAKYLAGAIEKSGICVVKTVDLNR